MTTDVWVSSDVTAPPSQVNVKKYAVENVDGANLTIRVDAETTIDIHCPSSLLASPSLGIGSWVWCIQANSALWPFAID